MKDKISPLVAIHCLVYNHEPYLRDCLEGFVMQQTNFPFVAIVHDDVSTDASAAIIREYEAKYPHIFKPIYETENQFSKKNGSLERIMDEAIEATGAKYVALCEGDDYWIDPLKLQKQVDFMEENPECSLCFHKVKTLIHSTHELVDEFLVRDAQNYSTILDLARGNYIHTPSVLYRREKLDFNKLKKMLPCLPLDYVMWMLLAENGTIYKINEYMAVYRFGGGYWESSTITQCNLLTISTLSKLSILMEKYQDLINKQILDICNDTINISKQKDVYVSNIKKSYAYRIGYYMLWPLKKIKQLFNKL